MTRAERTFLALSVALTFLACGVAQATCKDDMQFRRDKQQHFYQSALGSAAVATVTDSKWIAFGLVAAYGGYVELRDSKHEGWCGSWQDFAYDLLGNLAGLGTQHVFIGPNRIVWKKEF